MKCHTPLSFTEETPAMVVGVVDSMRALEMVSETTPACDLLEYRLDCLGSKGLGENPPGLPVLVTARSPCEGGRGDLTAAERGHFIAESLSHASAVDVEVASFPELEGTLQRCADSGIPLVGSFHDFVGVPEEAVLLDVIAAAHASGAALCKIATTPTSISEICRLAALLEPGRFPLRLSVMGMGRFGKATRLLFAEAGSILNYGYLIEPTVPGQWPAEQLRRLLDGC